MKGFRKTTQSRWANVAFPVVITLCLLAAIEYNLCSLAEAAIIEVAMVAGFIWDFVQNKNHA